jgi:hypothetical protein
MERIYLLWMGEREDFNKNGGGTHSHSYEEEKDPTLWQTSHTMGLFEGDIFLSHKMET